MCPQLKYYETMNDFLRPFTEDEFNKTYLEAGYPEIAQQYCHEQWQENFDYLIKENISETDLPELIEHAGWTSDCIRNQAWTYVKEYSHIDIYVLQRELGHGHEWAKLFCEDLLTDDNPDDAEIYWHTYNKLRSQRFKSGDEIEVKHNWTECCKSDSLSCREYTIAIKSLAKDKGEIVERYIDYKLELMYEGTTDELYREALSFRELYESLINDGYEKKMHSIMPWILEMIIIRYSMMFIARRYNMEKSHMMHGRSLIFAKK